MRILGALPLQLLVERDAALSSNAPIVLGTPTDDNTHNSDEGAETTKLSADIEAEAGARTTEALSGDVEMGEGGMKADGGDVETKAGAKTTEKLS